MTAALRTAIPLNAWPKIDQDFWERAVQKGGILEPDGAAAHWADATTVQVAKGYGKWLWALESFGALEHEIPPEGRVTEDRLRRYVAELQQQGLSSVSITSRVTDLMEALRAMVPNADLSLLRRLVSNLHQRAQPSRNKACRIKPPGEIWEACAQEMDRISSDNGFLSIEAASRYRDALTLGFLVWSPVRRRNLASLNLGETLIYDTGRWRVSFGAQATKDKSPLIFALPDNGVYQSAFNFYLSRIRPRLLRSPTVPGDALSLQKGPLWISTRGKAMTAHALYYAVTRASERLLGAPLNPHLLRDCAASAITSERPDYVLAASRILGHSQLSTTLSHYDQASMLTAGARLQEVIEEITARWEREQAISVTENHSKPFCDPWEST